MVAVVGTLCFRYDLKALKNDVGVIGITDNAAYDGLFFGYTWV